MSSFVSLGDDITKGPFAWLAEVQKQVGCFADIWAKLEIIWNPSKSFYSLCTRQEPPQLLVSWWIFLIWRCGAASLGEQNEIVPGTPCGSCSGLFCGGAPRKPRKESKPSVCLNMSTAQTVPCRLTQLVVGFRGPCLFCSADGLRGSARIWHLWRKNIYSVVLCQQVLGLIDSFAKSSTLLLETPLHTSPSCRDPRNAYDAQKAERRAGCLLLKL